MFEAFVTSPEEALAHLFFHCCFRDGKMTADEIDVVSEKLVVAGLNREMNFKDEVMRYQAYRNRIGEESVYVKSLVAQIHPTNELALFSVCIELCLSDGQLHGGEEALLQTLGAALGLDETTQRVCTKLMVQRKVVETEKTF